MIYNSRLLTVVRVRVVGMLMLVVYVNDRCTAVCMRALISGPAAVAGTATGDARRVSCLVMT